MKTENDKKKQKARIDKKTSCNFCGKSSADLMSEGVPSIRSSVMQSSICATCATETIAKLGIAKNKVAYDYKASLVDTYPNSIYKYLDKYIAGQDAVKKKISVVVSSHLQRINNPMIPKKNVLIAGPSGSGKTEIARQISDLTKVPFVIADCTQLTPSGYVGNDTTSVLTSLLAKSDGDVDVAQNGIIVLDEFDKISQGNGSSTDDTISRGVQSALLKMVEGSIFDLQIDGDKKNVSINTDNILFIAMGAFTGLNDLVSTKRLIGLNLESTNQITDLSGVTRSDLTKAICTFGLKAELVGRFNTITQTHPLTRDHMLHIISSISNSVTKQYRALFESYGVNVKFSKDFLNEVVDETMLFPTGARALKGVFEDKITEILFRIDKYKRKTISIGKNTTIKIGRIN